MTFTRPGPDQGYFALEDTELDDHSVRCSAALHCPRALLIFKYRRSTARARGILSRLYIGVYRIHL